MQVLVNYAKNEIQDQGLFQEALRQQGLRGKGTSKIYEIGELLSVARAAKCDAILLTNQGTLRNVVPEARPSLMDWRGSVLQTSIPIVITNPIAQTRTTILGDKLFRIDIAKIKPAILGEAFLYDFAICQERRDLEQAKKELSRAAILCADIETDFHNQITSIAFTPILSDWSIAKSYTISLLPSHYGNNQETTIHAWEVVQELCEGPIATVFHNGVFDCFHLLRYHVQVYNYLWDTEYIWRCWHAEMPRALAKIGSYILPDYYYWKHEAETDKLEYNAKDSINTARILKYQLAYAPKWVWTNYSQLLPNIGPAIATHFEGFLVDRPVLAEARKKAQADLEQDLNSLCALLGLPDFNPGSWQQVNALIYGTLGAKRPGRAKSKAATGETELKSVARQHPLYAEIVSKILAYRENKKAISTYYDALLTKGDRLLYSLSPDGTETLRFSCSASSLRALKPRAKTYVKTNMQNYGTQIQNVPYYYKLALMADPGYRIGDIDKSQSEARCTGYISKSKSLVDALENPPEIAGVRDFYCYTGYKFFGVEFDKDHPLRQAVKRIIHGTNYMMGAMTFIDAVGVEELREYKKILGYRGTLLSFARKLLGLYHEIYPEVQEGWKATKREIISTGKIVTPDGFVRIVEGDIQKHHSIFRSVVAHKSQHWSVVGINEALWRLFYELQVPSNGEFRLKGQIHDSIVYQAKEEKFEEYTERALEIMDIPQECEFGTMRIPLDTASGIHWKGGD